MFVKTTSTAATLEVKGALDVRLFIAFLQRLIDGASGKLFLSVDNLPERIRSYFRPPNVRYAA